MCGIVGIVNFDPTSNVATEPLDRMRDALVHRGPDGEGTWADGPVAFGHRRLAIVDIAGGGQPMGSDDGNLWITYNGEIYNHPELKAELEARGHQYRSRCDTETILHIYMDRGEACVESLRGMFAFALWDRAQQKLLLARDRLGIKPLYYAVTDRALLFASEIKAILASGYVRPALNKEILPEYLATGFVSGSETFFHGIKKLLPGRTLTWSRREGLRERRYWQPHPQSDRNHGSFKSQVAELRDRLTDAVRSHLMSDVPLGLFLSGGIDSTGLGALMRPMVKGRIKTFSVGFREREANELQYARIAANAIGSEHHEVIVSADEFFAALPKLVWHEDEPIPFTGSIPLYFVSAVAREHVKVVLTGEGADELFCGYSRYRVTAWNHRLGDVYGRVFPRFARKGISRVIQSLPRSARHYLGRTFLSLPTDPRSIFFDNFAIFPKPALEGMLGDRSTRDPFADLLRYYEDASGGILDRMTQTDMQSYLVELLMKQDQMSMAASIESRVPYLDHELVEYVMSLPAESKLRGWQTKYILREVLRDVVPPEILSRKKMGFPVPIGAWLRGEFDSMADEFITGPRAAERGLFESDFVRQLVNEHRSQRAQHGNRLWLLMNLEIWQRIFLDGESTETLMTPHLRDSAAA